MYTEEKKNIAQDVLMLKSICLLSEISYKYLNYVYLSFNCISFDSI
jgi:hypothetical protein